MKNYTVNVNGYERGSAIFFIRAENEDRAKEKAAEEYREITDQVIEFYDCQESLYI